MSCARRLHRLFAALGLHVVSGFLDKPPGHEELEVVSKFYVELGLDGEAVHIEAVRSIEEPAAMADC